MKAEDREKLKGVGTFRARPEYFIKAGKLQEFAAANNCVTDQAWGGLACYHVKRGSAPEPIVIQRVYACHRTRPELMLLGSFWCN